MTPRRLSAFEALGRGLANLRGNLGLVATAMAGSLLVVVVALAALAPLVELAGLGLADVFGEPDPQRVAAAVANLDLPGLLSGGFGAALLLFLAGVTVASLVQCWFQAGLLGVLGAGDAQAPPGPRRPSLAFRTFSPRFFAAEARRLFGRLLGFYTLLVGCFVVWLLLVLAVVLAAAFGGSRWGGGAAVAIGCGGAIPVGFALFVLALTATFGQGDLPRPDGSAAAAVRAGLSILGRRLGACVGLYVLLIAAALAIGVFQGGAGFAARLAWGPDTVLGASVEVALFLVQTRVQSVLALAIAATAIAIVRAEHATEPTA